MMAQTRNRGVRSAGVLAVVLLLAGCGSNDAALRGDAPVVPRAPDPIAIFAASATPGADGTVTIPETGQNIRVRLLRAYAAASGRECREVAVGGAAQNRLLCRDDAGWVEARPLLRGATPRP